MPRLEVSDEIYARPKEQPPAPRLSRLAVSCWVFSGANYWGDGVMKLFIVMVAIRYPKGVIYNYDGKVAANNRREAIRKLIDFEMITKTMICESSAVEIEGVIV